ncbi:MAG: DUF1778 domain-containing protein [Acidobacteria bacterium]|nr:DUF1778 domain-containing protein [Acidobacteriota bacterium]
MRRMNKRSKKTIECSTPPRTATESFALEIHLSARDSQIILAAAENPPKPNAKLKRAAARFNRMFAKKS